MKRIRKFPIQAEAILIGEVVIDMPRGARILGLYAHGHFHFDPVAYVTAIVDEDEPAVEHHRFILIIAATTAVPDLKLSHVGSFVLAHDDCHVFEVMPEIEPTEKLPAARADV